MGAPVLATNVSACSIGVRGAVGCLEGGGLVAVDLLGREHGGCAGEEAPRLSGLRAVIV